MLSVCFLKSVQPFTFTFYQRNSSFRICKNAQVVFSNWCGRSCPDVAAVLCCVMLCCAVVLLCYAMLCCAVLLLCCCCVVLLFCAMLCCCAVLFCAVLYYAAPLAAASQTHYLPPRDRSCKRGHLGDTDFTLLWSATKNFIWKTSIELPQNIS